jgi:hypothetical protein
MRISLSDAQARYGLIQNGMWGNLLQWCVSYALPPGFSMMNGGILQRHIYCNKDIEPALDQALKSVLARGLSSQLKTFDGCLMVRDVRGLPGQPSCHSYACAVDFNAATNQLGDVNGDMSPEVVQCFKDAGFAWGGDFQRVDKMHFSLAWE